MSQQLELFPDQVYLSRIDPAENMNRYYGMHLERNLFGEWCLVRQWGRIGTQGHTRRDPHASPAEALDALLSLKATKLRRGYH